ncbi:hypothetical protein CAPTEDRAFT_183511 [Capitella teleta]|uniref:Mitochondrial import inner membrane translocase subunit TIM44 n=1 Tax=Capitella teleta TaxID=283909 RepID=R7TYP1_CAPTE|nr:hypothetical protein CAPTEDRAFT_183511 [Capitella teleta]|eukprot:ELT96546.1 hypothetical protein CAPTEDRAFT_183511 [Capitella teleta]
MSGQNKNFFANLWDNLKQDFEKNKEMKDNLKKFREEQEKLNESEALQKAREKFKAIESETSKGSEVFKEKFTFIQEKVKETVTEVEKSDYAQKGKAMVDELGKTVGKTAQTVKEQGEQLSQTQVFKTVSQGVKTVKDEFDEEALSRGKVYKAPENLRRRNEFTVKKGEEKPIEADEDTTGVVMHKDSKWNQSWQSFKDNNQVVNKLFDMKMKYDESDHVVVRLTRSFTDKMGDLFGNIFTKTELSEVVTEIVKLDANFNKEKFIQTCQYDIVPTVLEGMVRGDLAILEDWCYEATYNTLAHPLRQAKQAGYKIESKILDINNMDIIGGKMMDQGPVIIISFNAQQVAVVRDPVGKVIEGNPDKILKVFHVWALCRDPEVLDPRAAWRVLELSSAPQEQWL